MGQRIAESIVRKQREQQTAQAQQQQQPPQSSEWHELPRPLAYYYQPHQFQQIPPQTKQVLYDFTLRDNHVLWIMQVASNWWDSTWSEWRIDGATIETVYRWINNINSPLVVSDRYLIAYKTVQWIVHNDSDVSIMAEVLLDGVVYHLEDWKKMNKVGKV